MSAFRGYTADRIMAGNKECVIYSGQPKACSLESGVNVLNILISHRVWGNGPLTDGQSTAQLGEVNVHPVNHGVHLLDNIQLQLQLIQFPVIMGVGGESAFAQLGIERNQLGAGLIEQLVGHFPLDLPDIFLKGVPKIVDIVLSRGIKLLCHNIPSPKGAGDLDHQQNQQQNQNRTG